MLCLFLLNSKMNQLYVEPWISLNVNQILFSYIQPISVLQSHLWLFLKFFLTMSGPYDLLWPDRLSHPLCSLASVTTCTSFIRSLPVIVASLSFLKGSHESCLRTYQSGVLPWGFCLVSLLCPNKLSLVFQWLFHFSPVSPQETFCWKKSFFFSLFFLIRFTFESDFRFTAKLSRKYRDWPYPG